MELPASVHALDYVVLAVDGQALWAFFSSSMIASILFTACTISAVVQILAVQECSDEHEITVSCIRV